MLRSVHSVADWFLCHVQAELRNANRDDVKRAYVGAGSVAWDDCCGTLVVAPERVYRSQVFPGEFVDREVCDSGWLNVDLMVMLLRCVPTVDDRGRVPSNDALDEAYKRFLEDAGIVWNALQCAQLPDDWEKAMLSQTFVGADGGCVAVESRMIVGVPQSKWGVS